MGSERTLLTDIVTGLLEPLSNAKAIRKKGISEIPHRTYYGWIPNNSGMLRLERVGIHDVKGRLSFLYSSCVKDSDYHKTIECIDTDLHLRDDIPTIDTTIRDYWRIVRESGGKYPSLKQIKKIGDFFYHYGWSTRTRQVLYTAVNFKDENGNPVKSGEGHKVANGIYDGKVLLCFYHKSDYIRLFGRTCNIRLFGKTYNMCEHQFFKRIRAYYSKNRSSDDMDSCAELGGLRSDLIYVLKKNPPRWIYSAKFSIESRGKITIDPLEIHISEHPVDIDSLTTDEGYKHIMQMMYGMVKKVFHGDNHHHHKDDVILRVYSDERQNTLVLDNMASHLKGLEKVEIGRATAPCHEFIPNYSNEAIGVQGYAQMYYKNYVENSTNKTEGERLLASIDVLVKSLKSASDRHQDQQSRNKRKDLSEGLFRNPAIWILILSVLTFLWNITGYSSKIAKYPPDAHLADETMTLIVCSFSSMNLTVALIVITFGLSYFKWGTISRLYCYHSRLHSDGRPKDIRAAHYFDTKKFPKIMSITYWSTVFAILVYILYNPSVNASIQKYIDSHSLGIPDFLENLSHCQNCLNGPTEECSQSKLPIDTDQTLKHPSL